MHRQDATGNRPRKPIESSRGEAAFIQQCRSERSQKRAAARDAVFINP